MGTLTLVLQVSMNMLEVQDPQRQEQMPQMILNSPTAVHEPGDVAPKGNPAAACGEPKANACHEHDVSSPGLRPTRDASSRSWTWRPFDDDSVMLSERRGSPRRCLLSGDVGATDHCESKREESREKGTSICKSGNIEPSCSTTTSHRQCASPVDSQRGTNAPHSGRMGSNEDHMGQEAPGAHLLSGAERGHGLLRVEPVSLSLSSSSSTRLPWTSAEPCAPACMSLDVHLADMIESCRLECSRFKPHHTANEYQQSIEKSLNIAQNIADDVFMAAPKSDIPRNTWLYLKYMQVRPVQSRNVCAVWV